MSSLAPPRPAQRPDPGMEAESARWHPAQLGDADLLDLHHRLDRLRRLDDAFADVTFSAEAKDRLGRLLSRSRPDASARTQTSDAVR